MSTTPNSNDDDVYHLDGDDELDASSNTPDPLTDDDDEELRGASRGMSHLSIHSTPDEDDDSDTDSPGMNSRRKERWSAKRAWEMRRCGGGGETRRRGFGSPEGDLECRLMVRPRGRHVGISMDMEEVRACRDLGLTLPRDWTVEISGAGDTSSGGSSPISDWRISSPGDSPKDIKARLKVWAQAVALASTSRLSN